MRCKCGGFTLIEILLVLLLMVAVLGGATVFLGNLGRSLQSEQVMIGSRTTEVVPARSQLVAALACQQALIEDTSSAHAIFVLGGVYEQGPATSTAPATTSDSYVPTTISGAVPLSLQSPSQLRAAFSGGSFASSASDDYTIFFLTNAATISAIVQVRAEESVSHRAYAVDYYRGGVLQDGTGGTERLSYRYALPLAQATAMTLAPGARHYWLRQSSDWNIQEHLGTRCVFPDPTLEAHGNGNGGVVFPRFIQFFPTRK